MDDLKYLRSTYPPIISSEQLRKILHVSKRKCAWMLQNGLIPCIDSHKKTRRYMIELEDGKDNSSSLQMIGRPLMTVDELKSMPKGQFIVMKTGTHPMISPLKLYFQWGIQFEEAFILPDRGARPVAYMERDNLFRGVQSKYATQPPVPEFAEHPASGKRFSIKTGA